jgi:hypothetical protein
MRFITLSLASLFIMSSSVFADASFDGVNAQIGVGFANLGSESNWSPQQYKYGEKGVLANISLGYSHKFENQFNIAANAFHTFGSDKSGGRPDDRNTIFKTNDIWGVVFEPGYYFSQNTLGFLKLGYARAASEFKDSGSKSDYGNSNGFLYGLGFKQMIQDHIYVGAEAYQIDFSKSNNVYNTWWESNTNNKPSVTYGGITLGYNFGSNHKYESSSGNSSGAFNGINAQLGLGFAEKSSEFNYPVGGPDRFDVSDKGILSNLSLGYSYHLNNQFNIAANVFYNLGSSQAGEWRSGGYKWEIKDVWGVSVEPGYYFTNSALAYLKVGYARASSKSITTGSWAGDNSDFGTSDGFLYGIGFKQLLTNNIYIGMETYQIDFSKSKTVVSEGGWDTNNKPALTYGGIMIGYKF